MSKVPLYIFRSDDINIFITASFKDGNLMIEGLDIGPKVEAAWGETDYEYIITVQQDQLENLCKVLNPVTTREEDILRQLANTFGGSTCFSDIQHTLKENNIAYSFFNHA